MELKEADKLFATATRISALEKVLYDKKTRRLLLSGLEGSSSAMLFAGIRPTAHPHIIIADDLDSAGYIYNDLCQIAGPDAVGIFPSGYKRDIKYGQPDAPSQILRTEVLDALGDKKGEMRFVITYPEALAEKVADAATIADNSISLKIGSHTILSDLTGRLRELGFRETEYVYEPGQFARRGSIVDVYSYSCELPYRIDFFDDEVDSIRSFNEIGRAHV